MFSFLLRPHFRLVPDGTRIRFMKGRFMGLMVSAVLSTASIILFFHPGLHLGIDFSGGIVMEVRTPGPADFGKIRAALAAENVPQQGVQRFGAPDEVLIRLGAQPSAAATDAMVNKVQAALAKAEPGSKILRTNAIGASVSAQLLHNGILALVISLAMILVYIWFRFEWEFAVGAVVTLVLDITKAVGFLVLTRFDFDLVMVAAILTILGYSTNDKVVVYDRVRENLPQVQDDAAARPDRSVDQRNPQPDAGHEHDAVPGGLAAGAVRPAIDLGLRMGDAVRDRGWYVVVHLHRCPDPASARRGAAATGRRRPGRGEAQTDRRVGAGGAETVEACEDHRGIRLRLWTVFIAIRKQISRRGFEAQ